MSRLSYIGIGFDPYRPWNRKILQGIADYAKGVPEWHLMLFQLSPSNTFAAVDGLKRTGGVIIEREFGIARAPGTPVVSLHPEGVIRGIPSVIGDMVAIGRMAAGHLAEAGYAHLACLPLADAPHAADRDRHTGFRARAHELGLAVTEVPTARSADGRNIFSAVESKAMCARLRDLPKPCGFFARNLDEAYGMHYLIRESGLHMPDDIGLIVGGDDRSTCEALDPPLTGVDRGMEAIGFAAAGQLHRLLRGETVEPVFLVAPVGLLKRGSTARTAMADQQVRDAVAFIWDHIHEPFSIERLAGEVHLTRRTLLRRFKAVLGRAPLDEIRRARVETAKRLLRETALPLGRVSERCGYAESSQLSRAVKATTGMTPTQYRNSRDK